MQQIGIQYNRLMLKLSVMFVILLLILSLYMGSIEDKFQDAKG